MKNINKMCSFYVNDWHLTVMILPYINNKLSNNEKVTIISEQNLFNNVNTLLNKLNIKNDIKAQIKNIGWTKTEIKEIDNKIIKNDKNIIIIGRNNYIENVNKIIEEKIKDKQINIIDCYEVMDFNNNMENILKNHNKIINTSGEKEIQEIFDGFSKKEII